MENGKWKIQTVGRWERGLQGLEGFRVLADPVVGIGNDLADVFLGPPEGASEEAGAVAKEEAQVGGAVLMNRGDGDRVAGGLAAELGEFAERSRVLEAARDIADPTIPVIKIPDLSGEKVAEVIDVEKIAHLFAMTAVADVAERTLEVVGHDPERDDSLVHFSKLPRTSDDPAAVDDGFEPVGRAVFFDEVFGGELRGAVERAGTGEIHALGDSS